MWVYTLCACLYDSFFLNVSGLLQFPGLSDLGAIPPPSHSSRCHSWWNQFCPACWFQSVKVVWRWLVCMKALAEPPSLWCRPRNAVFALQLWPPCLWVANSLAYVGQFLGTQVWPDTDSTTVRLTKQNMRDVELLPANRIVWITVA